MFQDSDIYLLFGRMPARSQRHPYSFHLELLGKRVLIVSSSLDKGCYLQWRRFVKPQWAQICLLNLEAKIQLLSMSSASLYILSFDCFLPSITSLIFVWFAHWHFSPNKLADLWTKEHLLRTERQIEKCPVGRRAWRGKFSSRYLKINVKFYNMQSFSLGKKKA